MNWIFPQTSRGSFSAVSTPIFASKYSLESSRRDLHNALLCTVLESNPKKRGKPWGEKILVQSRENRPGEAHRQLHRSTQCYPRARSRITAVWQTCEYTWDMMTLPGFRLVELTANRMSFVRISCDAKLFDKVPRSLYRVQGCCMLLRSLISIFFVKNRQNFFAIELMNIH